MSEEENAVHGLDLGEVFLHPGADAVQNVAHLYLVAAFGFGRDHRAGQLDDVLPQQRLDANSIGRRSDRVVLCVVAHERDYEGIGQQRILYPEGKRTVARPLGALVRMAFQVHRGVRDALGRVLHEAFHDGLLGREGREGQASGDPQGGRYSHHLFHC